MDSSPWTVSAIMLLSQLLPRIVQHCGQTRNPLASFKIHQVLQEHGCFLHFHGCFTSCSWQGTPLCCTSRITVCCEQKYDGHWLNSTLPRNWMPATFYRELMASSNTPYYRSSNHSPGPQETRFKYTSNRILMIHGVGGTADSIWDPGFASRDQPASMGVQRLSPVCSSSSVS
jgi:hypothetical protein